MSGQRQFLCTTPVALYNRRREEVTDKLEEVIMKAYKWAQTMNMHTLIIAKILLHVPIVKLVVSGGEVR